MSDWKFKTDFRITKDDLVIGHTNPSFGDAFSPIFSPTAIPGQLSSLNWCSQGTVKLYAADMTFIGEYGAGQKMLVPDKAHIAMGKVVMVASSDDVEYYCLSGVDSFYTGEVMLLSPNQEVSFPLYPTSAIFVSKGSIVRDTKEYPKGFLLTNKAQKATISFQAGEAGAIITSFNKV